MKYPKEQYQINMSFKTVEVIFKDSKYNYRTSVNASATEKEIKDYFENKNFDLGHYPEENFQKCIQINVIN